MEPTVTFDAREAPDIWMKNKTETTANERLFSARRPVNSIQFNSAVVVSSSLWSGFFFFYFIIADAIWS